MTKTTLRERLDKITEDLIVMMNICPPSKIKESAKSFMKRIENEIAQDRSTTLDFISMIWNTDTNAKGRFIKNYSFIMTSFISFLSGKKTYFLVAFGAIVWIAEVLGKIDQGTANNLFQLLGIGAVGTIRAAISSKN